MDMSEEEIEKYPLVALVEMLRKMENEQEGVVLEEGENTVCFYAEDGTKVYY